MSGAKEKKPRAVIDTAARALAQAERKPVVVATPLPAKTATPPSTEGQAKAKALFDLIEAYKLDGSHERAPRTGNMTSADMTAESNYLITDENP